MFERERPDLVIADVRLREGDGISAARPMEKQGAAVMFVTAHCFDLVMSSGVGVACLQKPFDPGIIGLAALAVLHYEQHGSKPAWAPSELHLSNIEPEPVRQRGQGAKALNCCLWEGLLA